MNRFLSTTAAAALAALLPDAQAPAEVPATTPRPAPTAEVLPPFETARTDAYSWMGRFGSTNCAWFDLGDGVLLLDTGGTAKDTKNLLAEVKKSVPDKPVRWIAMTHLHPDSNEGFEAMIPTDVTLIVNEHALEYLQGAFRGATGKAPTILAVADTVVLRGKAQSLEIHAVPGSAHTDHDLWIWAPAGAVAYVGDLVTPTRCPIVSDPRADPKGWLAVLDKIEALHPQALVASRGPATAEAAAEIRRTRAYLKRTVDFIREMKAKNAPEARVSGELFAKKLGEYCPMQMDTLNALELYRRMQPDGTFAPMKPTRPPAPAPGDKK